MLFSIDFLEQRLPVTIILTKFCTKIFLDKVVNFKDFSRPNKKSSTFQGTQPNSRTFQDDYQNSRPFQDCTNHVKHYPMVTAIGFLKTYQLDSDLSRQWITLSSV